MNNHFVGIIYLIHYPYVNQVQIKNLIYKLYYKEIKYTYWLVNNYQKILDFQEFLVNLL